MDHYAHLSSLTGGQCNDVHPLVYTAGSQGENPNMLSHGQAMKAVDREKFKMHMTEELDNMYENKIYGIIKKIDVREGNSILRSVWSHRRKTTSDGVIYYHRSRL